VEILCKNGNAADPSFSLMAFQDIHNEISLTCDATIFECVYSNGISEYIHIVSRL